MRGEVGDRDQGAGGGEGLRAGAADARAAAGDEGDLVGEIEGDVHGCSFRGGGGG